MTSNKSCWPKTKRRRSPPNRRKETTNTEQGSDKSGPAPTRRRPAPTRRRHRGSSSPSPQGTQTREEIAPISRRTGKLKRAGKSKQRRSQPHQEATAKEKREKPQQLQEATTKEKWGEPLRKRGNQEATGRYAEPQRRKRNTEP